METVKVCEKTYEIVEAFEYHVLVQDVDTGAIFLIEYQDLYPQVVKYEISNVISLRSWKKWPSDSKTEKKKQKRLLRL